MRHSPSKIAPSSIRTRAELARRLSTEIEDPSAAATLREIAENAVRPEDMRESLILTFQDVQPAAQAEDEQDRLALTAPTTSSEDDVLRALQAEQEAQRDERY